MNNNLVQRMEALIRRMGDAYLKAENASHLPSRNDDLRDYAEARELSKLLPDPDEREAKIVIAGMMIRTGEGMTEDLVALATRALKRGRELATENR